MKKIVLVSMLTTIAINSHAGPLLKSFGQIEKPYSKFGLSTLTQKGLSTWEDFAKMVENSGHGHTYGDLSSRRMGLLDEQGNRMIIHMLERNPKWGQLKKSAIEIPPSELDASSVKISESAIGVDVERTFQLPSGAVDIRQGYHVATMEGKKVRLQNAFAIETPNFQGYIDEGSDSFMAFTAAKGGKSPGYGVFSKSDFDGRVVAYNLQSNGARAVFHLKRGDQFIEETYTLTPTTEKMLHGQKLETKKVASRVLTREEVKRFGLLAEETTIAGRTSSAKPVGGMKVDESVGDSIKAGQGMK